MPFLTGNGCTCVVICNCVYVPNICVTKDLWRERVGCQIPLDAYRAIRKND